MRPSTGTESGNLRYRRQFVLGPRRLEALRDWPCVAIGTGLVAQAHPDLGLTQVQLGSRTLTLLGYMLDPRSPDRGDREILEDLARGLKEGGDAGHGAERLGGRWVLVVDDGSSTTLFADACGLRQVFYSDRSLAERWCASQAFHVANAMGLAIAPEAQEFLASEYVKTHIEYFWPGDSSPYAGVRRLLPNHGLDLRHGTVRRFWPWGPLAAVAPQVAVARCAELLRGTIEAASRRFPLAVPITAGYDSRTILAATRNVSKSVFYYTLLFASRTPEHRDVAVPARLLPALGLRHRVIPCPARMSSGFGALYRSNVEPAHEVAGAYAEGLFAQYPQGHVSVSGHASEIARCGYYDSTAAPYFWAEYPPIPITPDLLAAIAPMNSTAMAKSEFAVRQFAEWLKEAIEVERDTGMRILDLFCWEQWTGSWAAAGQAEWDVVHERLTLFANRELLTTMLGVDARERACPDFRLYPKIMQDLWAEVLTAPINPRPASASPLRDPLRRLLDRTGTLNTARRIRRLLARAPDPRNR